MKSMPSMTTFSSCCRPSSDGLNPSGTAGTYLEEMYESWQRDPASVHSSWDAYFRGAEYSAPPTVGDTRPNTGEQEK